MMTNQDEVLKLAEAAGFWIGGSESLTPMFKNGIYDPNSCESSALNDYVAKLIALAKQSAYEDAAKLCDAQMRVETYTDYAEGGTDMAGTLAGAIRNRAKEQS